ncbi:hypothetical protein KAW38_02685 [Candidatus Micrarchaeota archaeon]|nr:hypothetical protein [Candidatus Micrarchaeota archaeon]
MDLILSIRPKYASSIFEGTKKYEFRKFFPVNRRINKVYIYVTSPVKKITGFFVIEKIIKDEPKEIWKRFRKYSGLDKRTFFEYFNRYEIGYAIKIKEVYKCTDVINPFISFENFNPPQSFCYIDPKMKGCLVNKPSEIKNFCRC